MTTGEKGKEENGNAELQPLFSFGLSPFFSAFRIQKGETRLVRKPQKPPNDKSPDGQRLIGKMSEEEIDYNVMGSFRPAIRRRGRSASVVKKRSTDEFEGRKISANEASQQNELF